MKKRRHVLLLFWAGLALLAGARPAKAIIDEGLGGYCPGCEGEVSCLLPDGGYLTVGCIDASLSECDANGA